MLSKSQIKLIRSLSQKKYRNQHGLFIAEGVKVVSDLLDAGMQAQMIYATEEFSTDAHVESKVFQWISEEELRKISSLKSPNQVLALFKIPKEQSLKTTGLILALDEVNDPGNLGTIIRLCDWFGVDQLVCSNTTVDCFNSKVVQATMGSLARVSMVYADLEIFLRTTTLPIYGAVMNGENVNSLQINPHAILVLGNEANGISERIKELLHKKITIPKYNEHSEIDSLNVAMATAILLSLFKG